MKLRIKGDSVRVRLSITEVKQLCEQGQIEDSTHFGNNTLSYSVQTKEGIDRLSASFDGNNISLFLPAPFAKTWESSPLVGYDANMDTGNGRQLYLLLEKDYKCLDNTMEDQSDNFENPLAANFKK